MDLVHLEGVHLSFFKKYIYTCQTHLGKLIKFHVILLIRKNKNKQKEI